MTSPFWVGAMGKNGILLTSLPPVEAIGADFFKYDLFQKLKNRRIKQKTGSRPDGAPIYIILAPVMAQNDLVGILAFVAYCRPGSQKVGDNGAGISGHDPNQGRPPIESYTSITLTLTKNSYDTCSKNLNPPPFTKGGT